MRSYINKTHSNKGEYFRGSENVLKKFNFENDASEKSTPL